MDSVHPGGPAQQRHHARGKLSLNSAARPALRTCAPTCSWPAPPHRAAASPRRGNPPIANRLCLESMTMVTGVRVVLILVFAARLPAAQLDARRPAAPVNAIDGILAAFET